MQLDLANGPNLKRTSSPYSLPDQKENVAVFLVSGSYEYDLELIKKMPPPRSNYKNIVIPYSLSGKFGPSTFKYSLTPAEYQKRLDYLGKQRMVPQLKAFPNTKANLPSTENIYIPISDLLRALNKTYRGLSAEYIASHVTDLLGTIATLFHVGAPKVKKIWMVDANRYKIYDGESDQTMRSDLINGVLGAYLSDKLPPMAASTTFVFRTGTGDYKMDLPSMSKDGQGHLQTMRSELGVPFKGSASSSATDESIEEIKAATIAANQGEGQLLTLNITTP